MAQHSDTQPWRAVSEGAVDPQHSTAVKCPSTPLPQRISQYISIQNVGPVEVLKPRGCFEKRDIWTVKKKKLLSVGRHLFGYRLFPVEKMHL